MKKLIIITACAMGFLSLAPTAEAGYRSYVVGHDCWGRPIVRVVWVSSPCDYPRYHHTHRHHHPQKHYSRNRSHYSHRHSRHNCR